MRILFHDDAGRVMLDAIIPPGAFDGVTLRGWKVTPDGHLFKYKHLGRLAPLSSGIKTVVIRDSSLRTPGLLKFAVVGKNANLPTPVLPIRTTVVIDAPVAATGQCGEATFPGPLPAPTCRLFPALLFCK